MVVYRWMILPERKVFDKRGGDVVMEPWGNPDIEAREKQGKCWGNIIKN